MPRAALVPRDEAIAVVEKYIEHFKTNDFPPYSAPVYKQMSKDLGKRWSHHNVYTSIREDRRKILTTARANQGVYVPQAPPKMGKMKLDETDDDYENVYVDEEHLMDIEEHGFSDNKLLNIADDLSDFEVDAEASGLAHFDVLITREEWQQMKGQPTLYGARSYTILNPGIWTNILALAIARQTRLPCAFVFDNSKIYESPNSVHYLKIKGHCRSKLCQNELYGYVDRNPGDNDFYMTIRTRDTMGEEHEDIHRPLRGVSVKSRRKTKFGNEVVEGGCSSMRQQAAKYVNIYLCRRCNYPNIITKKK
uniref:Uncharacterized protein n=1 Tax=Bracon brevicornis TaxID=1563983 RepID=A0A6V7ITH4_9HYME